MQKVIYIGGHFDPLFAEPTQALIQSEGLTLAVPVKKDEDGNVIETKEISSANLVLILPDGTRNFRFNVPHASDKIKGGNDKDIDHPYYITEQEANQDDAKYNGSIIQKIRNLFK